MRLRKNNKPKLRLPTVEEILGYRPNRLDFKWSENAEGLVEIIVPKFTSNFGKSFCKVIRKDDVFTAKMDKIGTVVWKNCNVRNSVEDILKILKKEFPKDEDIDNRLFLFLQQMHALNYIEL